MDVSPRIRRAKAENSPHDESMPLHMSRMIITAHGRCSTLSTDERRNHRTPSDEASDTSVLSPPNSAATDLIHEHSHTTSNRQQYDTVGKYFIPFLFISFEIFNIDKMQFYCTHHQTGNIYSALLTLGEETGDEVGLTFFERFHPERHTLEVGNHLFCVA